MMTATALGFGGWQPLYAEHGIPTFPVKISDGEKRPAIRGYLKIGMDRSRQLAKQRPNAEAFGFVCGRRSGVTVLDVDTANENVLADALDRHGKTPLIVRSGGHGHYQAWYRWNGEGRRIRPDAARPIDVLGNGFVVAPPSQAPSRQYEIVSGSLDDIAALPKIKGLATLVPHWEAMGPGSGRNNELFRTIAAQAHSCDDFDTLLDCARTLNDEFSVPMDDARTLRVAKSVWKMTVEGRNRFGQHGAFFPVADMDSLVGDPHLFALLAWLRAHNGPNSVFIVANGLADILQWPRRQLFSARRKAIELGRIVQVRPPMRGSAARYRWPAPTSEAVQ